MKKLFIVLAVAALASCNNDAKTEETKADTTVAPAPAAADTTAAPAPADTTAAAK